MATMLDIGRQLQRARLAAGLTQRELARRAGSSVSLIGLLEKGDKNTTIEMLDRLATAADTELVVRLVRKSVPVVTICHQVGYPL